LAGALVEFYEESIFLSEIPRQARNDELTTHGRGSDFFNNLS